MKIKELSVLFEKGLDEANIYKDIAFKLIQRLKKDKIVKFFDAEGTREVAEEQLEKPLESASEGELRDFMSGGLDEYSSHTIEVLLDYV